MKKNMIALLLSIVMTVGSISGTPALAAETTAQEAAPVEETASEEIEDISEEEHAQEETAETVESEPAQEETTEAVEEDSAQEETTEAVEEEPTQESDESVGSENTESTVEEEQTQEEDTAAQEETSGTHDEIITAPGTAETVSTDAVMSQVASGTCGYSGDNLTWVLDDEGTLTISGTGQMKSYKSGSAPWAPWYSHKTQIVAIVISNGVTSIGNYAFSECSSLTSVTIPDSVTSIGEYAFYKCSSLTSVTIPDSVTSIRAYAFYKCSSLTSVTIPDSVTSIRAYAFYQCSSLTSVTIPDSVTSIGEEAFSGCSSLTSVTIPDSVTSIGDRAFGYCSSLTSVTIPDSVTSIGDRAFSGCSSLTSVTIPDSVTSIGEYAFSGCSSLTSVTIPDSVTSIGEEAFSGCSNLTSVTIPDSVTSIGDRAFSGCSSLTSVTIGNSVTSIGDRAFQRCSSLTAINVVSDNSNFASVDGVLFDKNKTSLIQYPGGKSRSYTILSGVTSIGEYAFYYCSNLTSVTIPDSVTRIGDGAFYYCSSLTSVTIPDSVTSIGEEAFCVCSSLTSVAIPDSVTSIGYNAFGYCSSLTSVTIGNSVTSIGTNAFYHCSSLTSVTIGNSVTSIGNGAFQRCSNLTSVTIPDSVTSIGEYAFSGCSSLTSVTIPDSVTSIGYNAFQGCSSLTSVTIPDSVTSIGSYAFQDCSSLTSVTIGNSVTSIGAYAFYDCNSLTSVTIPDSVTSIGNRAFFECSSLTSVTIGNSVTSIREYAFYHCSSLTSVTIPDSVTSIGDGAFGYCPNLVVFTNNEYVIQYCKTNNIKYCTCVTEFYPEIGATNVDHNSEHLFFIDFAYNFVPNGGYAYLYESGKTECVDKIHIYDPSTDANASTDNDSSTDDNASEIGFRYGYGNTQNGLELNFSKNKLQKGKKYSIAIDSDAIRFVDDNGDEIGVEFPGLKKDVWTFTTVDLDYFSFTNPDEFVVPLRLYTKLFGPIESARLRAFRSHGEDGLCFGLDYLVGLNKLGKGYILEYLVNASKNLSELGKSELTNIKAISLDYSLLEYLQLAFIYQYSEGKTKESKDNKNKYDKLYEAVKNCSNSPITIGIKTDGGYHAIYPITVLKDSSDYCEVLVYDSTGYTFSEGDHVGLFTYLQKLKINKSNGKCTGVEYQNDSGKTVTYRTISNLFDYTIGNVSPIYMVSCERIPGEYDGLYPIESTNGDSAVSQEERYLYWLEGNTFDVVLSEDNTLSLTDGYDEIEVTASTGASVNLDIENITAKVENTNASENVYTITHTYAVNDDNFKSVVIKGETSSTVNTKKTEDGIIVTNEDGTPVQVEIVITDNNTVVQNVETSATTDSINIKYDDENTLTVTEDADSDGTYETVIVKEETAKEISGAEISGITNKTYTGKALTQSVIVKYGDAKLVQDADYTVSYKNNINAGTASVTITGIGNYTGSVTKTFTINKAVNKITAKNFIKTYSTKAQSFWTGVKVADGVRTFKSNSKSVTVSKSGKVTIKAKFIGKATITITAPETKNYKKTTKKITITVNPTKTALSSVTSPSAGKMTVKWKKNAVGTGYLFQYSTSSKFKSPKTVKITKNTTLSKTIGGLAKGKKYYVRIRTYKTVGKTKFYSAWSAAKTVTIKK